MIEGVINFDDDDMSNVNNEDEENDVDDQLQYKINKEMKEILFGDINYNNNYDKKMPNFYRKLRYDIKKPGPRFYEEYFFKPDNSDEDGEGVLGEEKKSDLMIQNDDEGLNWFKVKKVFLLLLMLFAKEKTN